MRVTNTYLKHYFAIGFPLAICHAQVVKRLNRKSLHTRGLTDLHVNILMSVYAFNEMGHPCRWSQLAAICGRGKLVVLLCIADLKTLGLLFSMDRQQQYIAFKRHLTADTYELTREGGQACRGYIREYLKIYKDICDIDLKDMISEVNP